MAQLPTTHFYDLLKSLAIVKGCDINLATYLKHAVATSVSHCTLNKMHSERAKRSTPCDQSLK